MLFTAPHLEYFFYAHPFCLLFLSVFCPEVTLLWTGRYNTTLLPTYLPTYLPNYLPTLADEKNNSGLSLFLGGLRPNYSNRADLSWPSTITCCGSVRGIIRLNI